MLSGDGLKESVKVLSGDVAFLKNNYSVIVNDLTTLMKRIETLEKNVLSQKRALNDISRIKNNTTSTYT